MTRILILGAGGQVARSWTELLAREGVDHDAWTRADFDLSNPSHIERLRNGAGWELVVNCAAYTQVDKAESEYELAERVNGTAVGELAVCCKQLGSRLIHYSTDYVFDGEASVPYPTDAPIAPVNAYGRSKAVGERKLLESGASALLIRTSWVYAPWGKNFVLTMARLLRERPELSVVSDQVGRPTSAQQLAERSWALSKQVRSGTYHLTDAGECSWHELSCAIRDELGLETPVRAIPSSEFPTPAKRPSYSVLDISSAEKLIGPARPWRMALSDVLDRWQADQDKG